GSISYNFTKSIISTALSVCSFCKASSSSLSKTTNLSLAYSYALTISSFLTSLSHTGHTFSYFTGDWHSLCSCLSFISLFSVAACIFTGMLTRPKLIVPFHIVCIDGPPFIFSLSVTAIFMLKLFNLFQLRHLKREEGLVWTS